MPPTEGLHQTSKVAVHCRRRSEAGASHTQRRSQHLLGSVQEESDEAGKWLMMLPSDALQHRGEAVSNAAQLAMVLSCQWSPLTLMRQVRQVVRE